MAADAGRMTTAAKPAATRATAPASGTSRVGRVRGPRIPPPIVGTLPWERSHAGIDIEVCQGFHFAERERVSDDPGRGADGVPCAGTGSLTIPAHGSYGGERA